MTDRDAMLVACSDPSERERVRESFLKRKLGLTEADAALDMAIEGVGCVIGLPQILAGSQPLRPTAHVA